MTEEAELQAKIAAISGQINQHKQQQQPRPQNASYHPYPASRGRGNARWSPYGRGARGGRGGYAHPPMNRTLVLNGAPRPSTPSDPTEGAFPNTPTGPAENFVTTRARGMNQLMNKNTYEREQKQKLEHKQQARVTKRQKINRDEKLRLMQHTSVQGSREIVIEGIRFQLREDGSKLIRLSDENSDKETPKKVTIADVDFFRTKNGNLVRANAVKVLSRPTAHKPKPQCEHFTKHGNCPYGRNCHFTHDPEKIAICPAFLKNKCIAGDNCDLSHTISYSRVPACVHFLRGHCTNDACRYPHVHVSPSADVCRPFALFGYCDKGADCDKRHVYECPDYANTGSCDNPKCPLPHPDRASTLRKVAAKQAKIGSEDESDMSSDEDDKENELRFEDIDSDEAEDVIMGDASDDNHEVSQQQDFIAFT